MELNTVIGKIFRQPLIWLTNTDFYAFLLLRIIPFLRFSVYYTKFRGNVYNMAYAGIRQGDFIVARDSKKVTTMLIGGDWSHASLFMGKVIDGAPYEVAEMTHHNYTKSDFFDVCKESTDIMVLRLKNWDPLYARQMIEKCKEFENALYDVGFELGVRSLYCSELCYQADFERRMQANLEDLKALGRQYISPSGLAKAPGLEVVFDSRNKIHRY